MAKSKAQKQAEAIERKMAFWDLNFARYSDKQFPNRLYNDNLKRYGKDYADSEAAHARRLFGNYCKEVGRDFHGNPV
jgi:hypothetical protein